MEPDILLCPVVTEHYILVIYPCCSPMSILLLLAVAYYFLALFPTLYVPFIWVTENSLSPCHHHPVRAAFSIIVCISLVTCSTTAPSCLFCCHVEVIFHVYFFNAFTLYPSF